MNEINKHLAMVRAFHEAFNYTQAEHETSGLIVMPNKTRFGRMSFIAEELAEILGAIASGDRVEQLDGAVDLAYFALGTLAIIGCNVSGGITSGRDQPLQALVGATNRVLRTLSFYEEDDTRRDLSEALSFLYLCSVNFADRFVGADFDAAFEEVQRSNMSKLGEYGEPVYNGAGKICKGPNFSEPVLLPYLRDVDA